MCFHWFYFNNMFEWVFCWFPLSVDRVSFVFFRMVSCSSLKLSIKVVVTDLHNDISLNVFWSKVLNVNLEYETFLQNIYTSLELSLLGNFIYQHFDRSIWSRYLVDIIFLLFWANFRTNMDIWYNRFLSIVIIKQECVLLVS